LYEGSIQDIFDEAWARTSVDVGYFTFNNGSLNRDTSIENDISWVVDFVTSGQGTAEFMMDSGGGGFWLHYNPSFVGGYVGSRNEHVGAIIQKRSLFFSLGQANGVVNQGMGPSNAFLLGTGFAGIKKVGQLSVQEINRQAAINKVLNSSSIHGAPVKVPKVLRFVGRFGGFAFSAWGAYDIREQYRHGEITPFQNGVEQASNTIGAIPAVGTA
jgi:hypothetical protein